MVLAFKLRAGDGKEQPPFLIKAKEQIRKEVVRLLKGNGFLLEDEVAVHG